VRLSRRNLDLIAPAVARPTARVLAAACGVVHLGVGAFSRAHQGVFLEDAMEKAGGDFAVIGVSMRKPDVAEALAEQNGLYTVETLAAQPSYRVMGLLRHTLTLPQAPAEVSAVIASPRKKLITLTVTEKGYCLAGEALDFDHPDVKADLVDPQNPKSAIGALVAGLALRRAHGAPITVISCDNLMDNGRRLRGAVLALAERSDPALARWIEAEIAFPDTMVDCIVPASDAAHRARVEAALGLEDHASVQREPFAEWVIENRFAADRPALEAVGVELVEDVSAARRLKLHVLNAAHSTLAYLGLPKGHVYVRDAAADAELMGFVAAMMREEVAPALPGLPVLAYWEKTAARFANPAIAHRLDQIAEDGAFKLAQRIYPLMTANRREGRPYARLVQAARAYLRWKAPGDRAAQAVTLPEAVAADVGLTGELLRP
jgi:fructuronate reductase